MNVIFSMIGGAAGAAFVSGAFAVFQYKLKRKDEKNDAKDSERKALRYIMLYIIQERAKEHIRDGMITLEDRRLLRHWHSLYHSGLGGNGDADALMNAVDKLPVKLEG